MSYFTTSSVNITPYSLLLIHGASGLTSMMLMSRCSNILKSNFMDTSGFFTWGIQKNNLVFTQVLKGKITSGNMEQSLFYDGKGQNSAYYPPSEGLLFFSNLLRVSLESKFISKSISFFNWASLCYSAILAIYFTYRDAFARFPCTIYDTAILDLI